MIVAVLGQVPSAAVEAQQQFDALRRLDVPDLIGGDEPPLVADFNGDGRDDLFFQHSGSAQNQRVLLLSSSIPGAFINASNRMPPSAWYRDLAAVVIDYDLDGDLDILLSRGHKDILKNDGTGRFVNAGYPPLQPWHNQRGSTGDIGVGDVSGDGVDDLVFADGLAGDHVYHGQPNGIFTFCPNCQPTPLQPFSNTLRTLLADFDGDGDLDLFRLTRSQTLDEGGAVYDVNDGQGHWTRQATIPNGPARLRGAVTIDYDGDGDLDVLAYGSESDIVLFENQGGTSFSTLPNPIPGATGVRSMTVADRDGDGRDDLLISAGSGVQLLQGTANGTLRPFPGVQLPDADVPSAASALIDADSDGDLDIVFSAAIELWIDESDRFIPATATELTSHRGSVATGDLDGDGDLDVLVASGALPNRVGFVMLNDGDGRFVTGPQLPLTGYIELADANAVKLADLNGDGNLDALLGRGWNRTYQQLTTTHPVLLLGNGDGTFRAGGRSGLPSCIGRQAFALGDIDGDGDLDLAMGGRSPYESRPVAILRNDGNAAFSPIPIGSFPGIGGEVSNLEFADIDADGDQDLLLTISWVDQLQIWRNNGSGRFTRNGPQPPRLSSTDEGLAVADFDADGDLDVLTTGRLLENDGAGNFTNVTRARFVNSSPGRNPVFLDVDADGDLDLITATTAFRQDAAGNFQLDNSLFGGPPSANVWAADDLDGDGDTDLICTLFRLHVPTFSLHRNLAREISIARLPRIGGWMRVAIDSMHPPQANAVSAAVWIGARRLPQPIEVPTIGLWRLDPNQILHMQTLLFPGPGREEFSIRVPNQPALAGADVHVQALLVRGPFPNWSLTRAETVTILR